MRSPTERSQTLLEKDSTQNGNSQTSTEKTLRPMRNSSKQSKG
jgi:hypothetical protein